LERGQPIVEVARELDMHEGTLGNWVNNTRLIETRGVERIVACLGWNENTHGTGCGNA
jgi:transposase-like protein